MSEIASCTLIQQDEHTRQTEKYLTMFKKYPDVVSVEILQEMLGICRKNAYLLVKENKIVNGKVRIYYSITAEGEVYRLSFQRQLERETTAIKTLI